MRKTLTIFIFLFGLFSITKSENRLIVLSPSDDIYVQRLHTVPTITNAVMLPLRRGTDEPFYNRYAILKFNLSSGKEVSASEILFRFYYNHEQSGSNTVNNDIIRQLYLAELPKWDWTESTLSPYNLSVITPTTTHNSQFSNFVSRLETDRIALTSVKRSSITTGAYWEWNVTDFIHTKISTGDSIVTFLVYESLNTGGQGSTDLYFNSKENSANPPELVFLNASVNSRLQEIILNDDEGGETILNGFNPYTMHYNVTIQAGNTAIPTVTYTLSDPGAILHQITQASNLDGTEAERTATIEVMAKDNATTSVYTITFKKGEANPTGTTTVKLNLWKSATVKYERDAQIVSLLPNFKKDSLANLKINAFGSNLRIRTDATGYFYVKKLEGRWWLIDPDGYAGVNMAVTSINTPASKTGWAFDMLKSIGFNGAGNFITPENLPIKYYNDSSFEKFTYTRRGLGDKGNVGVTSSGGFFQRYQAYRKRFYTFPSSLDNNLYVTIMDPEFVSFCDIHASHYVAPYSNERNMLGYFSDNEIAFNQDQLLFFLRDLPETDSNYQSALAFITTKGISKETVVNNYTSVSNTIKEEYASLIAEYYYKNVSEAIRKYDPNHLYLGSRLNGRPKGIRQVVEAAARYCDVISVNFYDYPTPKEEIVNPSKWGIWTKDKPCLITEFHTKALEPSNVDLQAGAGYMVKTQKDRGVFYQNTCLEVLQSKYFIGWQYFRWMDDDAQAAVSNKGIVSPQYEIWTELSSAMKELNTQVYPLIDYIDKRTYPIKVFRDVALYPQEDSYITFADGSKEVIHGLEDSLVIANSSASTGLAEAFLSFDLGAYKDSLSYIDAARIRLNDASGKPVTRNLQVIGVDNSSLNESTFQAEISGTDLLWRSAFGKLRNHEVTLAPETPFIDLSVRSWILSEKSSTGLLTFRITDESTDTQPSVWYSREKQGQSPQLLLTMLQSPNTGLIKHASTSSQVKVISKFGQLEFYGLDRPTACTIYNISGGIIYHSTVGPNVAINAHFPQGIYLVKLTNLQMSETLKVRL